MTRIVKNAIVESILRNRIVTISNPSEADELDLLCASDDSAQAGSIMEYWGKDEDGDNWRIHTRIPC